MKVETSIDNIINSSEDDIPVDFASLPTLILNNIGLMPKMFR
jgi:hypothetical protein